MKHDYDFQDRMAAGKVAAEARRSKGLHAGKSAKGWDRKAGDYAPIDDGLELFDAQSRSRFEFAISQFLEDVNYDVHGDQWEGF